MASPALAAEYVERSARAYEDELRAQLSRHGVPDADPVLAGRRAALAAAASQAWEAEVGPFHDTDGVRVVLGGVTKQAVSQRVAAGRLLGLRLAADGSTRDRLVYPAWQFHPTVLRLLPAVLAAAGVDADRPVTGWTVAAWLVTGDAAFEGSAPLDLLRAGHLEPVLTTAAEVSQSLGVDERRRTHVAGR